MEKSIAGSAGRAVKMLENFHLTPRLRFPGQGENGHLKENLQYENAIDKPNLYSCVDTGYFLWPERFFVFCDFLGPHGLNFALVQHPRP
jgi:hypothetical protein